MRASARIHLNDLDQFVKFKVELNEIPVKFDKVGKDVVADWTFYDDFDTKQKLYVDANGLQMIDKKLFYRKEYPHKSWNTIAANYYPVTSAIAVKDEGKNKKR